MEIEYQTTEEIIAKNASVIAICLLIPLIWNFWKSEFMPNFFPSSHIDYMKYFVLYLRSFNDDKRNKKWDRKLMSCLYTFFCPFAIGKPNDIKSYGGSALRIFVGDDWKDRVLDMMEKTPIILLRVSDTENFFWEFEQCTLNNYIDKSLLWVSDVHSYKSFKEKASTKHNIALPSEEDVIDNCVIYREGDKFTIFPLGKDSSYDEFAKKYGEYRGLTTTYSDYFAGRDKSLLKTFFTWKRDPDMMDGVQKWSWTAFLIPEFYIVFQRFPNRNILYLILVLLSIILLPFRIILMIYMGRNAKKIVWLKEKWESLDYFNRIHEINCYKALIFAAFIVVGVIILFNIF